MNISVVIPFRDDGGDRRDNLIASLRYYRTFFPAVEVVVSEHSDVATADQLVQATQHKHVLFDCDGKGPFSRGRCINAGVLATTGTTLVVADADLFLVPALLVECFKQAEKNTLVKPYNNIAWCTKEASVAFRNTLSFHHINPTVVRPQKMENVPNLTGGMFIIEKNAFMYMGGYDERFVGWGKEDEGTDIKVHRLIHMKHIMPHVIAHLYHPKAEVDRGQWRANCAVVADMRRQASMLKENQPYLIECRKHGIKVC